MSTTAIPDLRSRWRSPTRHADRSPQVPNAQKQHHVSLPSTSARAPTFFPNVECGSMRAGDVHGVLMGAVPSHGTLHPLRDHCAPWDGLDATVCHRRVLSSFRGVLSADDRRPETGGPVDPTARSEDSPDRWPPRQGSQVRRGLNGWLAFRRRTTVVRRGRWLPTPLMSGCRRRTMGRRRPGRQGERGPGGLSWTKNEPIRFPRPSVTSSANA